MVTVCILRFLASAHSKYECFYSYYWSSCLIVLAVEFDVLVTPLSSGNNIKILLTVLICFLWCWLGECGEISGLWAWTSHRKSPFILMICDISLDTCFVFYYWLQNLDVHGLMQCLCAGLDKKATSKVRIINCHFSMQHLIDFQRGQQNKAKLFLHLFWKVF